MMLPTRAAPGWDLYAPYDCGRLRNLGRFLRGDRRPPPGLVSRGLHTAAGAAAARGGTGIARVEAGGDVQSELEALQQSLKAK